jgi:hypothetical protein
MNLVDYSPVGWNLSATQSIARPIRILPKGASDLACTRVGANAEVNHKLLF